MKISEQFETNENRIDKSLIDLAPVFWKTTHGKFKLLPKMIKYFDFVNIQRSLKEIYFQPIKYKAITTEEIVYLIFYYILIGDYEKASIICSEKITFSQDENLLLWFELAKFQIEKAKTGCLPYSNTLATFYENINLKNFNRLLQFEILHCLSNSKFKNSTKYRAELFKVAIQQDFFIDPLISKVVKIRLIERSGSINQLYSFIQNEFQNKSSKNLTLNSNYYEYLYLEHGRRLSDKTMLHFSKKNQSVFALNLSKTSAEIDPFCGRAHLLLSVNYLINRNIKKSQFHAELAAELSKIEQPLTKKVLAYSIKGIVPNIFDFVNPYKFQEFQNGNLI